MIPSLASFFNLAGPDFLLIAIILFVLFGIPALIALPIIFIVNRRSKKSPPLPVEVQSPKE